MDENELNRFYQRRHDGISLLVVTVHLLAVIGPIYLSAVWGPGYHLIAAWLIYGLGMNGIINLMHECAHYLVFRDKIGSDILGRFIIAPLLLTNFNIYRKRHWEHHKHLGVEGETKDAYHINIKGRHIFLLLLRCLFLIEAVRKFFKQIHAIVTDELYEKDRYWAARTISIQVLFYFSLAAASRMFGTGEWPVAFQRAALAYFFVYIYGVMSLTVFAADLRAIAEHQLYDNGQTQAGCAALRNFKCTPWSRFIMGCYGFGEHYTHHKIPGIPYYALEKTTEILAQKDQSLTARKGYFQTLSAIIRSLP